jgi:hypothetical protein
MKIRLPKNHHGVVVCYGGGVDSTAMLIKLRDAGIVPDAITFADVGAEKPETYETVRKIDVWLKAQGFPLVTWVKKIPKAETGYKTLVGNNYKNETLPSLAFGKKSCSIKWKADPQDYFLKGKSKGPYTYARHPVYQEALDQGKKIVKLLGYDAGPADLRRSKNVKREDEFFLYSYPLQDLGMTRGDCIATIVAEGLEVPIKSACFFCPASQVWELYWLAGTHPDLFLKALEIEHRAMTGRHSRWGSDECTYGKDWEDFVNKPADQWPTTSITVGLNRSFAWNHFARLNHIVDADGNFIGNREELLRRADELQVADGGNAADLRTCA